MIVYLYDYTLNHSDKYNIVSHSDLKQINSVLKSMDLVENKYKDGQLPIGGILVIEVHKKNEIESYRIQGSYVIEETYKGSLDNKISTKYYDLQDKYYDSLVDLCNKLKNK